MPKRTIKTDTKKEIKSDISDFERDKQAKYYAIQAAKSRQDENGEFDDTFAAENPALPVTFKQKINNYWYHYRLHTIIILFLVVFVGIVCFVALYEKEYDATFTIVSGKSFVGSNDYFKRGLAPLTFEKKAKPKVDLAIIQVPHGVEGEAMLDPQQSQMNRAKLVGILTSGKNYLFLLDQNNYNDIVETGTKFLDISKLAGKDNEYVKGDKYYIEETEFSNQLGLGGTTAGMFLCIIDREDISTATSFDDAIKTIGTQTKNKKKNYYQKDFALLANIIDQDI